MAKINDGIGSGGNKPSSKEMEELLQGVFKDDVDQVKGATIGIDALRQIDERFNVEGKDTFEHKKTYLGDDHRIPEEVDVKKLRRESDTGLTAQMNRILMQRNLKNSGKV
jgi:hypothetical protein